MKSAVVYSYRLHVPERTRKIEQKSRDSDVKKSAEGSEFHSGNPGKLNIESTYQSKRHVVIHSASVLT